MFVLMTKKNFYKKIQMSYNKGVNDGYSDGYDEGIQENDSVEDWNK